MAPSTTAPEAPTTTTSPVNATSTLAGTPIEFGPAEGDVLMVIGVAHDDVLNLRAGPGVDAGIIDEIPPTYDQLVALGNTRELPRFWIEVSYEEVIGWVSMAYIGYEGQVIDETASVVDELGGRPTNATMTGLGEEIADVFVTDDEGGSEVVQVTTASQGDLAEITYDVIGLADDAIRGLRLHVFAEQVTDGYRLRNLETTIICGRGVDDDGLCP
jgi:hypothetical protein